MSPYWESYERSSPRRTTAGIKPQSQRGSFGEKWWSRRWITVLESFNIGARLGRGRSYARQGQVLDIIVEKGAVTAHVQGSRATPYNITMRVKPLSPDQWVTLAGSLSQQAIFAASLFAGEMPQEIESVFGDAGVSLFPQSLKEIQTVCSCPDSANPCKHIAAVHYLLGGV